MENEKTLCAELEKNCTTNKAKLVELLKNYELAKLGEEVQNARFKEIYDRVLQDNYFVSTMKYERCRESQDVIKVGDRITDSTFDFLLSDEEWYRYMDLTKRPCIEAGLTNPDDTYVTDWTMIAIEAKDNVVAFIIDHIVPASMRDGLEKARKSIIYQDKLIDAVKKSFNLN